MSASIWQCRSGQQ